ncbi:amidohydrolase family protein [Vibrio sp. B1FLJ16]|uniref:amidohydrolase family protein n=1 Tax=Vibrio sp. B1FLJ16 TaxID=2751178 RepID=UPI0015F6E16A|nr:amidohydrolase family protein [Vibrio sp. B1FLJ16]CAD7817852.1 2-pyrone-4,6-dicarbaxylate hydrolase [Vibrio sp. B1FLJ16]CAD7818904.1 2-pyrone-4,6-dicarbaxylate hydrolase [Vibrio sp. B1FLJ16]CAE6932483.1 2-pyrone-4,6-dicarbaxylate hydrolase [Vibrio sp. B1FLJ16]CAE6936585.1 2-pyrone-4,6-dicarbaxylate hydrolase [Vibrio sp. B1FLJ16]
MDKDYLPFHPKPSRPKFSAPEGAVDAHCHVFGPGEQFPYSPKRKYTPCDASKHQLFALRDHLGFSRNVIVQASCHGTDNAALIDALEYAGDLARGVAVVSPDITEQDLKQMHEAGVRAVRFNFVKRLVDVTPKEVFLSIAEKIKPLGWHIVVYFEAADFDDITPFLLELDTQIVIDHMGRPDVALGVEHPNFQKFVKLLADNPQIWTKVSCPERLTQTPPDYSDVVPFAKVLVENFPRQVLWGTDWPHPNMKSHMPDDGHLVDVIPLIAPTPELQYALLVENPMKLYWE